MLKRTPPKKILLESDSLSHTVSSRQAFRMSPEFKPLKAKVWFHWGFTLLFTMGVLCFVALLSSGSRYLGDKEKENECGNEFSHSIHNIQQSSRGSNGIRIQTSRWYYVKHLPQVLILHLCSICSHTYSVSYHKQKLEFSLLAPGLNHNFFVSVRRNIDSHKNIG